MFPYLSTPFLAMQYGASMSGLSGQGQLLVIAAVYKS